MVPNRGRVNLFLAIFLPILVIDSFHRCSPLAPVANELNDDLLAPTGLWQGPWRLYAPNVDNINLRLAAEIQFTDGAIATWHSPEWDQMSALSKFRHAREMNYLNWILTAGRELEWGGLCSYLARTTPHPTGGRARVESVSLVLKGAIIPDPDETQVPAGPYLQFDAPQVIFVWHP
jgi:hypothetical protein